MNTAFDETLGCSQETDLYILPFQFDVKATCKSGYVGTAAVTPCDEPNEAYVTWF
jgi:hypothetical protein